MSEIDRPDPTALILELHLALNVLLHETMYKDHPAASDRAKKVLCEAQKWLLSSTLDQEIKWLESQIMFKPHTDWKIIMRIIDRLKKERV